MTRGSSLDSHGPRQSAETTDPRQSRRINLFGKRLAESVAGSDPVTNDHAHTLPTHLILAGQRLAAGSTSMSSDSDGRRSHPRPWGTSPNGRPNHSRSSSTAATSVRMVPSATPATSDLRLRGDRG